MYVFLFNYIPLPIPPSSLEIKTPSMNKTVTLINEGEINIPKNQGLREISFEFLLPSVNCYPFAQYNLGMPGLGNYTASALIPLLNAWRELNEPTRFIVARLSPDYKPIYFTNILCLIEDFTYKEDAEELGFDTMCSITLKEYKPYTTKRVKVEPPEAKPGSDKTSNNSDKKSKGTVEKTRDTTGKTEPKEITTGENETIISGANKTGDDPLLAFDANDIKIPDSITNSASGTDGLMEEILPGVDLEKMGEAIQSDRTMENLDSYTEFLGGKKNPLIPEKTSIMDAVMRKPGDGTYARPAVPKQGINWGI